MCDWLLISNYKTPSHSEHTQNYLVSTSNYQYTEQNNDFKRNHVDWGSLMLKTLPEVIIKT